MLLTNVGALSTTTASSVVATADTGRLATPVLTAAVSTPRTVDPDTTTLSAATVQSGTTTIFLVDPTSTSTGGTRTTVSSTPTTPTTSLTTADLVQTAVLDPIVVPLSDTKTTADVAVTSMVVVTNDGVFTIPRLRTIGEVDRDDVRQYPSQREPIVQNGPNNVIIE